MEPDRRVARTRRRMEDIQDSHCRETSRSPSQVIVFSAVGVLLHNQDGRDQHRQNPAERFERCVKWNVRKLPAWKANRDPDTDDRQHDRKKDSTRCPGNSRSWRHGGKELLAIKRSKHENQCIISLPP